MYHFSGEEQPSSAVINAVAESTGQSPLELEPLAKVINPDALDALFSHVGESTSSVTIRFEYSGREVTVTDSDVRVNE